VTKVTVDVDVLRSEIEKTYAEVSTEPAKDFIFPTGRSWAIDLGYPEPELSRVPEATAESFAGVANPHTLGRIEEGATVLDLGCGAGFDTLLAAGKVGEAGTVIAVDMTEAMLEKTRLGAQELRIANVEVRKGYAEALPVESNSIDVVISNGVINLCPDKEAVFQELFRVLKPGGRVQIADMVVHREVPQEAKDDINLWAG